MRDRADLARPLTRIEDHDGKLAAVRVALEEVVSGIEGHELRPEVITLLV
jgi:hypothetical protein